jgi:hypothetical protein
VSDQHNIRPITFLSFTVLLIFLSLFTGGCERGCGKRSIVYESCQKNVTVPINCRNLKTKNYCVESGGKIKWVDAGHLDFQIDFNNGPFTTNPITSTSGETADQTPTSSGDFKYTIKCDNGQVEDPMIRVP